MKFIGFVLFFALFIPSIGVASVALSSTNIYSNGLTAVQMSNIELQGTGSTAACTASQAAAISCSQLSVASSFVGNPNILTIGNWPAEVFNFFPSMLIIFNTGIIFLASSWLGSFGTILTIGAVFTMVAFLTFVVTGRYGLDSPDY